MAQRGSPVTSRYPIGVIVIAALTALRCVSIVAALFPFEGSDIAAWVRSNAPLPPPLPGSDFEIVSRAILVGLLVASVLVVVGLLARKRWAWVLAIISSGVILAIDLGWWWGGEPRYGSMLLNSVAVFYLNQRDVRASLGGRWAE